MFHHVFSQLQDPPVEEKIERIWSWMKNKEAEMESLRVPNSYMGVIVRELSPISTVDLDVNKDGSPSSDHYLSECSSKGWRRVYEDSDGLDEDEYEEDCD